MEVKDLRILIADSNLATNLQLRIQLEKLGCIVVSTTNNIFRLIYLIENLKPNFIILDSELIHLAVENYLKKTEIPVLFTTCFGIEEILIRLIKQKNTIGYLVKPLDSFSLRSSIEWAVKFHLYRRVEEDVLRLENLDETDCVL